MIEIKFAGSTQDVLSDIRELLNAVTAAPVKATTKTEAKPTTETPAPVPATSPVTTQPSRLAVAAESAQNLMNITQAPKVEAATVAPTAPVKEYKLEELQVAMQPLINSKLSELQALLTKYGVPSLVELPKERYPEFAADLRAMGVQI